VPIALRLLPATPPSLAFAHLSALGAGSCRGCVLSASARSCSVVPSRVVAIALCLSRLLHLVVLHVAMRRVCARACSCHRGVFVVVVAPRSWLINNNNNERKEIRKEKKMKRRGRTSRIFVPVRAASARPRSCRACSSFASRHFHLYSFALPGVVLCTLAPSQHIHTRGN
jgi:hypothetical protein